MRYFTIITMILLLGSCAKKLEYRDYFNYFNTFNENSYIEKRADGFIYQLQYRPAHFAAINQLKSDRNISKSAIRQTTEDYGHGMMFCLRIMSDKHESVLKKNLGRQDEYYNRLALLNNDFPYMVKGLRGLDTVYCQFHHFERTYTVRPFIQVIFSMDYEEAGAIEHLWFEDRIFQGGNLIEFDDIDKYISKLPQLKL